MHRVYSQQENVGFITFNGEWEEPEEEGEMLHPHEWNMSTTALHFPFVNVFLETYMSMNMSQYRQTMNLPSFIQAYLND